MERLKAGAEMLDDGDRISADCLWLYDLANQAL